MSVVVVSWNAGDHLTECLRSIAANPPSRPWTAVVVDNASTDGSIARAKQAAPWCRFIENPTNRGLAAANNQGIVATPAPVVILSNPDVAVLPGALDALCDLLHRRPRAAVATPLLVQSGGQEQVSAGELPSMADVLAPSRRRQARFWWRDWDHSTERRIGHGAEALYAVRRAAIAEVGPQDERYFLDWEGIEWSRRFAAQGWEVWFTPSAQVRHEGGVSVRQVPYRAIARSHRGMHRYFSGRSRWRAVLLAPLFGARALAKAAAAAVGLAGYDDAQQAARLGR